MSVSVSAAPPPSATPRPSARPTTSPTPRGAANPAAKLPVRHWPKGLLIDGRFEVLEHLGKGGMSSVYLCKDRMLESLAAVKVLRVDDDKDDLRRRFEDEARILANLRHPHLVDVLARGVADDGAPFIALEYLEGCSLRDRLAQDGPMRWRDVVEVGVQIASALAALNDAGVIHRDVKPDNIMAVGRAGSVIYKLIDPGIAKVRSWTAVQKGITPAPRHQTEANKVVGTLGYFPPERGRNPPDPRFDVFGLGQTLHELCTREWADISDLRPMRERIPDIPPELEATIRAALQPLPDERIPDAHELRRHLEAVRWARAPERASVLFAERYEIVELLGVGAMGEVYRAYHRDAGCYLALKRLRHGASEEERIRFAREARALAAMSHPGLPRFFDCRTEASVETPYIAMELASGWPALAFCDRDTRLEPREVVAVGLQLARTLAAVHERGILHRDVNVGNVLIDFPRAPARHHQPRVKLVDFGMVALLDSFYAGSALRYPTPPESRKPLDGGLDLPWTAPEARAGDRWSPACDVWSMGFLLYRLLTGLKPADAQGRWVPPSKIVPTCPSQLGRAVLGALAVEPEERLSLAELIERFEAIEAELAAEEDELETDEPPVPSSPAKHSSIERPPAIRDGAVEPPSEAPRPRPARVGLAGLAALVGSLVLGGLCVRRMSPGPSEEPGAATPAVSTPPSRTATVLPTMTEALAEATPALRRCAGASDLPLIVEFTTASDRTSFVSAKALMNDDPVMARCIADALASVRFAPPADAPSFTKEYPP